jgi:hypothetical protein
MASDFSVPWQCLSKRTIVFLLWIKLHAKVETLYPCCRRKAFIFPEGTKTSLTALWENQGKEDHQVQKPEHDTRVLHLDGVDKAGRNFCH